MELSRKMLAYSHLFIYFKFSMLLSNRQWIPSSECQNRKLRQKQRGCCDCPFFVFLFFSEARTHVRFYFLLRLKFWRTALETIIFNIYMDSVLWFTIPFISGKPLWFYFWPIKELLSMLMKTFKIRPALCKLRFRSKRCKRSKFRCSAF